MLLQLRIDTGDPSADMLLSAALSLWEPQLTWLSGDGLVCVTGEDNLPDADAAVVLVFYRHTDFLTSSFHRQRVASELPYAALPMPVSLPQLEDAIGKLHATRNAAPLPLRMIPEKHLVRLGNRSAQLTEKEYSLFSILYENRGTPIPKETLCHMVWGNIPAGNVCEVHITHLRQKLTPLLGEGSIGSLRGKGYFLILP